MNNGLFTKSYLVSSTYIAQTLFIEIWNRVTTLLVDQTKQNSTSNNSWSIANILVNKDCDIRICDFGMARAFSQASSIPYLTEYVTTRWYRAPEIMISGQNYSKASMYQEGPSKLVQDKYTAVHTYAGLMQSTAWIWQAILPSGGLTSLAASACTPSQSPLPCPACRPSLYESVVESSNGTWALSHAPKSAWRQTWSPLLTFYSARPGFPILPHGTSLDNIFFRWL